MSTLGFEVEWFDNNSNSCQYLYLKYFLADNTIELLHTNKNATFLKRIFYPSVTLSDLFIGNSVTVYNRLLTIKRYANSATENFMNMREIHVMCTLNKEDSQLLGPISSAIRKYNFKLGRSTTTSNNISIGGFNIIPDDFIIEIVASSQDQADKFVTEIQDISGAITAACVDTNVILKALNSSESINVPTNCTLCLVKPHVLTDNKHDQVINAIVNSGKYCISGMMVVHLHADMTDEFFRVYRKVIPLYAKLIEQMSSGPVLALLLTSANDDDGLVQNFREFCGPNNCELAALIAPSSLRAIVGKPGVKTNIVENGIHCTDLPDDGYMECSYFFNTIANIKRTS